jgi:hypothetical protein
VAERLKSDLREYRVRQELVQVSLRGSLVLVYVVNKLGKKDRLRINLLLRGNAGL